MDLFCTAIIISSPISANCQISPRQRSSGGAMQFFDSVFASSDFSEPKIDKEECQNLFKTCNHL